jgi:hypothetical protein
MAARFAHASVVAVPKHAHAVLGQPGAKCAATAVKRFFAGKPVPAAICAAARRGPRVQPRLPAKLADVAPYPGSTGRRGRTLAATILTLTDLYREQSQITILLDHPGGGGLRAGRWFQHGGKLRVERFSLVPGVAVSGSLGDGRHPAGTLKVTGAVASAGKLTLKRNGILDGRLGGKKVRARFKPPPFNG